jgi:hypothetical protein
VQLHPWHGGRPPAGCVLVIRKHRGCCCAARLAEVKLSGPCGPGCCRWRMGCMSVGCLPCCVVDVSQPLHPAALAVATPNPSHLDVWRPQVVFLVGAGSIRIDPPGQGLWSQDGGCSTQSSRPRSACYSSSGGVSGSVSRSSTAAWSPTGGPCRCLTSCSHPCCTRSSRQPDGIYAPA